MEHIIHSIEPVFDTESRVLILGTMPSPKSREVQFYYGHPQNRFWRVLAAVLGEELPQSVPEKKAMLLRHYGTCWQNVRSPVHPIPASAIRWQMISL